MTGSLGRGMGFGSRAGSTLAYSRVKSSVGTTMHSLVVYIGGIVT